MALLSATPPNAYSADATRATRTVLKELSLYVEQFADRFVVIGGIVPWLLLDNADHRHVGSSDLDLGLNLELLPAGMFASTITALCDRGYRRRNTEGRFQLVRCVPGAIDAAPIEVSIDFLLHRPVDVQNAGIPTLVDGFSLQSTRGMDLAIEFRKDIVLGDDDPVASNRLEICSVPALIAMKGLLLEDRLKSKDAYDIYYCVKNYGNPKEIAGACNNLFGGPSGRAGYQAIAAQFRHPDEFGPVSLRRFSEDFDYDGPPGGKAVQRDAFDWIGAWLLELGI